MNIYKAPPYFLLCYDNFCSQTTTRLIQFSSTFLINFLEYPIIYSTKRRKLWWFRKQLSADPFSRRTKHIFITQPYPCQKLLKWFQQFPTQNLLYNSKHQEPAPFLLLKSRVSEREHLSGNEYSLNIGLLMFWTINQR